MDERVAMIYLVEAYHNIDDYLRGKVVGEVERYYYSHRTFI